MLNAPFYRELVWTNKEVLWFTNTSTYFQMKRSTSLICLSSVYDMKPIRCDFDRCEIWNVPLLIVIERRNGPIVTKGPLTEAVFGTMMNLAAHLGRVNPELVLVTTPKHIWKHTYKWNLFFKRFFFMCTQITKTLLSALITFRQCGVKSMSNRCRFDATC